MSQLRPPLYENLLSLKFETGSYRLKSMEKILYTLIGKHQINQHSEFSLET